MPNIFYKAAFLLLISTTTFSQNVSQFIISAQGDISTSENVSLEWTLGESFIETLNSGNSIITQGFHQSFQYRVLNIDEVIRTLNISIYPNPTSSDVFVQFANHDAKQYVLRLFDLHGRKLKEFSKFDQNFPLKIDVSNLSSGLYLLKIYDPDSPFVDSQKILKL